MRIARPISWSATNCRRPLWWVIFAALVVSNRPAQVAASPAAGDTVFVSVFGFPGGNPGSDADGDGSRANPYREITTAITAAQSATQHVVFAGPTGLSAAYHGPIFYPDNYPLFVVSEKGADSTLLRNASGSGAAIVTMSSSDFGQWLVGFDISDNDVSSICGGEGGCAGGVEANGMTWIVNNKIFRNVGFGYGGGIYHAGTGGNIVGNWIGENSDMRNPTNSAGGIYSSTSTDMVIVNNTIVNNRSNNGAGILIADDASGIIIANNIIAFNQTGYGVYANGPITITLATNLFYSNTLGNTFFITEGTGAVHADPLLLDLVKYNYHLTCASPARDAGDYTYFPVPIDSAGFHWDIDGPPQRRVFPAFTTLIDIGGDEFWDTNKKAIFFASDTAGCIPFQISFTNQSLCIDEQWIWDFGDGHGVTGGSGVKNPIHQYDSAGTYTVRLIAKGDLDSDTLTRVGYINLRKPLTPDFAMLASGDGCVPDTFSFTATLNTPADSLRWLFGDGQTGTGAGVQHVYAVPGTFSVELRAYNLCGMASKLKSQIVIVGAKPNIGITASSDSTSGPRCSPYAVRLHPITDQPLNSYLWDFGDSDTTGAHRANPSHTYRTGGTYSVRLIAAGNCGTDTAIRLGYIQILTRPTAELNANPTTGCSGQLTVGFSAIYQGVIASSTWLFGDGASAPGPTAQHPYSGMGTYQPKLVVNHACGTDTLSLSTPITVGAPPVASFSGTPRVGYEPLNVQFTDLSINAPTAWKWDFGDSTTDSAANPVHTYSAGIYDVSLLDSNACGKSSSTLQQYVRVSGFQPFLDSIGLAGDTITYSVLVDTVLGAYDRPIGLAAGMVRRIGRGDVNFVFDSTFGTPRFSTVLKVIPSGDFPSGDYKLTVYAIDPRITKGASRTWHFVGHQFISATPDTVRFGLRAFGGPYSKQVYIINRAPLASGFELNFNAGVTGFGFDMIARDSSINPQESTTVTVRFSPTQRGDYVGTLTINSDDPAQPVLRVPLRGRGTPDLTPPKITATLPPTAFDEIRIDSLVRFVFSEPVSAPRTDSIILATSKRTGLMVDGTLNYSTGSPGQPWNWIEFSPLPCVWFPPDDTIQFRVRAIIVDTSGNHLDGNNNNLDEGTPIDDYLFSVSTGPGVRPGDADQNQRVDEGDVLPIARFWGLTGPPRDNPCAGFTIQPATTWTPRAATHADADGNGVIDSADICPIVQYFNVDSSVSKVAIESWMTEARTWDRSIIRSLIGGLVNCPDGAQGRLVLGRFLEGLENPGTIPVDFSLAQNYPNPFNPATLIEYTLKVRTNVRLEVFDILGRLVTVLEDSEQDPSRHSRIWDGRDAQGHTVASGIYFYRLVTPQFQMTRKMVLLK